MAISEDVDLQGARRLFRDLQTAHVATSDRLGQPHVVPLWFVWLDDAIYVSCRRGSRVERNILAGRSAGRSVAVAFDRGRSWSELAGAMVTGEAELIPADHPSAKRALSAWFEKYRAELGGTQFGAYAEQVPEPVLARVAPLRIAVWAHGPLFG